MKTDAQVEKEVREELAWESRVNGAYIEVKVEKGLVTLSGLIDSVSKKNDATTAASRIDGVTGVVNELEVKMQVLHSKADAKMEKAVLNAILNNSTITPGKIRVKVKNAHVFLEGEVPWDYQRSRASLVASDVKGVVGVANHIKVVPSSLSNDVKHAA